MSPDRLEQLLEFYEEDPSDSFTRFAIAQEYRKRGEQEEAMAFFEKIVEEDPDYAGTYYHLGKLYEEQDRREDAVATYEQGIKVAREQRNQKDLSELQDALLALEIEDDM